MITFKQFLGEAAVVPFSRDHVKDIDEAISIIKQHCSKSLWMINKNTPIWRGDRDTGAVLGQDGMGVLHLDKSTRKSENTSNWYTMIFDNHPDMREFPKRSKSLICTTSFTNAKAYGRTEKNVLAIIPFDHSAIGWTDKSDIWDLKLSTFSGGASSLLGLNDFFAAFWPFGLDVNDWSSFKAFSDFLHGPDAEAARKEVILASKYIGATNEGWADDFYGMVLKTFAPTNTNMKVFSPSSLSVKQPLFSTAGNQPERSVEMWVGGTALCLSVDMFAAICEKLNENV